MSVKLNFANKEAAISAPLPPCRADEYEETGWGVENFGEDFKKLTINRPKTTGHLVKFDVKYCGMCHSDVHIVLNHFTGTMYPIVPGHELVGVVTEVGEKVSRVKTGKLVAVGCGVDSCFECDMCKNGEENYCRKGGQTHTYSAKKTFGHTGGNLETQTFGGYSKTMVVHERFIVLLPDNAQLAKVAPLVCAGITVYDPLRHWGATKGDRKMTIGVAGIGGLGTMGIKIAAGLGHHVVAISSSDRKRELALSKGAHEYVASNDPKAIEGQTGKLDLILNTISAPHDLQVYVGMLATNGTLVELGGVLTPLPLMQFMLAFQRKSISGSIVGGMTSLQECVDFCIKNDIYPDIEIVDASKIHEVYDKLDTGKAGGLRFVLDIEACSKM